MQKKSCVICYSLTSIWWITYPHESRKDILFLWMNNCLSFPCLLYNTLPMWFFWCRVVIWSHLSREVHIQLSTSPTVIPTYPQVFWEHDMGNHACWHYCLEPFFCWKIYICQELGNIILEKSKYLVQPGNKIMSILSVICQIYFSSIRCCNMVLFAVSELKFRIL